MLCDADAAVCPSVQIVVQLRLGAQVPGQCCCLPRLLFAKPPIGRRAEPKLSVPLPIFRNAMPIFGAERESAAVTKGRGATAAGALRRPAPPIARRDSAGGTGRGSGGARGMAERLMRAGLPACQNLPKLARGGGAHKVRDGGHSARAPRSLGQPPRAPAASPSKPGEDARGALLRARRSLRLGSLSHGRAGHRHADHFGRSRPGNRYANNRGRGRAGNRNHYGFGRYRRGIGGLLLAGGQYQQRAAQGRDHGSFTHISPLKVGTEWAVWGNAASDVLFPQGTRKAVPPRHGEGDHPLGWWRGKRRSTQPIEESGTNPSGGGGAPAAQRNRSREGRPPQFLPGTGDSKRARSASGTASAHPEPVEGRWWRGPAAQPGPAGYPHRTPQTAEPCGQAQTSRGSRRDRRGEGRRRGGRGDLTRGHAIACPRLTLRFEEEFGG